MASIRKIVHTTANDPTCESFKIFCRVAKSRRDKIASQQSMKPSRWIKPVSKNGSAARIAAQMAGSLPKRPVRYAANAQIPPTSSPISGRYTSCQGRAFSSQIFAGHGMERNMPHAIKKAVICVFISSTLLYTTRGSTPRAPRHCSKPRPISRRYAPVLFYRFL